MHLASQEGYVMFISLLKVASRLAKNNNNKKTTNKKTQTNCSIKLEFLKYPSNTTSFIFSPQQIPVHRHKLTHAAWPLHWLSLKIKKPPSPQTWLSPLPSFREEAEKEGGPYVCVQGCTGKNPVTLDPTDCSNGRTPLSSRTLLHLPACLPLPGYWHHHFKSIHNVFQICKQVFLQQLWPLA